MSRTLVIDGHPNPDSFCAALARACTEGATDAKLIALRDLDFDLNMRYRYSKKMEIEPDLANARQAIQEAQHLVVVTPVWWGSVLALLKGFFDRALLPGQDYTYSDRGLPVGLLNGLSARLLVTCDTPRFLFPLMPYAKLDSVSKGTLKFCGFKPVKVSRFTPVKTSTKEKREQWLQSVRDLASQEAG